ncbi:hypothetical protein TNCV_238421 [Trichonephila clavipes]|nr:hypothetical protein TNCV_238421 [Trichonephila clavipes]
MISDSGKWQEADRGLATTHSEEKESTQITSSRKLTHTRIENSLQAAPRVRDSMREHNYRRPQQSTVECNHRSPAAVSSLAKHRQASLPGDHSKGVAALFHC